MDSLDFIINLIIIALLIPALIYMIRLNRNLTILRENQSSLAKLVEALNDATFKAENSIPKLKTVTENSSNNLKEVVENAKELGAKRVIELKTSGPFHTEKLQEASTELKKELEKIDFKDFNIPVIKNLNGEEYGKEDNMVEILSNHVVNPVKFGKSIEKMIEMGVDTFIEIGPGKTLSGFVKKVCKKLEKEVNVFNIENIETLENTLQALK